MSDPIIKIGSTGEAVKKAQHALYCRRYLVDQSEVDGIFGPITRNRVIRYQLDQNPMLASGKDTYLFLWAGDRVADTVAVSLTLCGLEVVNEDYRRITLTVSEEEFHWIEFQPEQLRGI